MKLQISKLKKRINPKPLKFKLSISFGFQILKKSTISVILLFLAFITACNSNKFDVDVSNVKVDLEIKRLDVDMLKNYPDTPDVFQLMEKYGSFLELYGHQVLGVGGTNQRDFGKMLLGYNNYCIQNQIPSLVEKEFGDFEGTMAELEQSLKYFKHYFPNKEIPVFYTFLSNFNQSLVIDEGLIGIGLDKYLGAKSGLYGRYDAYKVRRMNPKMVVVDCMRAMAMDNFPYKDSVDNLLNQMVHEGKIQYFLDAMLPFTNDTLKFAYTDQQMSWAEHNEGKVWAYLVENQLLFSTDAMTIRKMIGDGPFTSLFANNSAPRAGAFIGWKIVHKYMDRHPDVSLKQLMENTNYQGILNSAKYKP